MISAIHSVCFVVARGATPSRHRDAHFAPVRELLERATALTLRDTETAKT